MVQSVWRWDAPPAASGLQRWGWCGLTIVLTILFAQPLQAADRKSRTKSSANKAPATVDPPAAANTEADAVQSGATLERARKWTEAIEHYEQTLKTYPENGELKYGLRRARVHLAIDRRYADKSFLEQMLTLSRYDALVYLDDAMGKVRKFYVDNVTPTSFVAHGTESLYLALNNDKFLKRNLPHANSTTLARVRRTLRDDYWNKPIGTADGAKNVVHEVCELTDRELGLAPGAVVFEYVFGGCNSLDDYSSYLTAGRLDDLYNNIEGEFVGIGIEMKADPGKGLRLVKVLPESPAAEGGARAGDLITRIEETDCHEISTEEAANLLVGKSGSRVRLELTDESTGASRQTTLTRRAVKIKSIPVAKIIDSTQGIGYIKMTGFQKNTVDELDAALAKLHREGMKSLVWDLRGNPGGLLTAAVEVLDRFIEEGVLVSTKGRSADQNWSYSAQKTGTWNIPLVLVVDGDSASASEIVAGAIRDHHRGQIVGRKTYGKWSVQSILQGRGNTGFRLTTARFYSPNGHTYGKIGIAPDQQVDDEPGHRTAYRGDSDDLSNDRDVEAALGVLKRQFAQRNP